MSRRPLLISFCEKIVDLYVEINKAQPVLEIDVPDVIATSKKRIIDEACASLNKVYKNLVPIAVL